jgi:hypothetical protein
MATPSKQTESRKSHVVSMSGPCGLKPSQIFTNATRTGEGGLRIVSLHRSRSVCFRGDTETIEFPTEWVLLKNSGFAKKNEHINKLLYESTTY